MKRSNKMPKDFAKRVSAGLKLSHRKRRIKALEAEVLRLAEVWALNHDGHWWFEGDAGNLERAVVALGMAKAKP